MTTNSKIEWTDATWNPLAGCKEVSPGCTHCYAAVMAHRLAAMAEADIAAGRDPGRKRAYIGTTEKRGGRIVWTGKISLIPEALEIPLNWQKPRRVFLNSMSDLFHADVPDEYIDAVFAVMALTPQQTYQVLTKRPERMAKYLCERTTGEIFTNVLRANEMKRANEVSCPIARKIRLDIDFYDRLRASETFKGLSIEKRNDPLWPLPNVQVGTSCEDQKRADERISHLLRCPAVVRFLSVEPMLGPVILDSGPRGGPPRFLSREVDHPEDVSLSWVICGGESGHHARPFDLQWARSLRDQCQAAGVPFFMKQLGSNPIQSPDYRFADQLAPGEYLRTAQILLRDPKGGNWDEWPESYADLKVREFPAA